MILSDNPTENLIIMGICVGLLAIAGIVHLIQKYRDAVNRKKYLEKLLEKEEQRKTNKETITQNKHFR